MAEDEGGAHTPLGKGDNVGQEARLNQTPPTIDLTRKFISDKHTRTSAHEHERTHATNIHRKQESTQKDFQQTL
jgi:hypothetical protein